MPAKVTGSGLDRANACPAACALPSVRLPSGEAAERGTAIHSYLETDIVPDGYEDECRTVDVAKARPPAGKGVDLREVTYAWSPSGAVVDLGQALGRDYGRAPDGSIPITLDRVWKDGGVWHVDDYKTGREPPSAGTLQLALGAVCVAKRERASLVRVAIVHINEFGDVRRYERDYDALDLDLVQDKLRSMLVRVSEARTMVQTGRMPDVSVGPWCRYCPAMAACPAYAGLAKRMLSGEDMAQAIAALPLDRVGEAWEQVQRAEILVKSIKEAVKARIVQAGGVDLPDGRKVCVQEQVRRSVDVDKAVDVFMAHDIEPDLRQSVTLAAVKAACSDKQKHAAVIHDLQEAGALRGVATTSLRTKKASWPSST